ILKQREPHTPIAAVGYSLGGNVLLKWLGETKTQAPIVAAAAVSVPFLLAKSARRTEQGFSRIYQWELVARLRRSVSAKQRRMRLPLARTDLSGIWRFRDFDEHVTAPLHGFTGADDYYDKSSSRQYLKHIATPTLIIHSSDDPFMTPDTAPARTELSPAIEFELYQRGGHVGFVTGAMPWRARYWLEDRIPDFLGAHLAR
ncbi:MAG TPA: alpha/beta fold hydrolase, partial [Burkholderiaceae bacterium]|nr:alpha/beta fold hydrolase [Burkholderiaceae bacterium]